MSSSHTTRDNSQTIVGLVSMPWMAPTLPSIQLATVEAALRAQGIEAEIHELFLDYAARIGVNLYNRISNLAGFNAEWLFAQHYYSREDGNQLEEFRQHRPRLGVEPEELEEQIVDALVPVTDHFIQKSAEEIDWSRYDVIGFSLTILQLASSMALIREIKQRNSDVTIVCGGSQCAGVMGKTLLKVCPYVDIVVHVEGEAVFPALVQRIRTGTTLEGLPGISWRLADGSIASRPSGPLHVRDPKRPKLNFDAYFDRLERCGLSDRIVTWLPFEGSRGCWYGEKSQCTFCGLHEIMEFRAWEEGAVLDELEFLYDRYEIPRFFSMDLIMPRSYFNTLLPEVERRGHDWTLFYEVKANMKRPEVEVLARSGVRWIQPGIESLDDDLLKLMKKGVSPIQNIQLLKWCQELGILAYWNLLVGLPGERRESYQRMVELMPSLLHLRPPSGVGNLQLHRFSPYFDHPEEFGIRHLGAHLTFRHIFPIPQQDLDDLVYLHDFEMVEGSRNGVDKTELYSACKAWTGAFHAGARLEFHSRPDGSAEIVDTRADPNGSPRVRELSPSEASLYRFLDAATGERSLWPNFARAHEEAASQLSSNGNGGFEELLEEWREERWVVSSLGKVMALAVNASEADSSDSRNPSWWFGAGAG